MKLLFLLFVITMAIQGSMSSESERLKATEEAFEAAKSIVPAVVRAVANAHNDVSMKWAYRQYRHELRDLYDKVVKEASERGACIEKSWNLITPVLQFRNEYNQDDAPAEAKEVGRLIAQQYDVELKKYVERLDQLSKFAHDVENHRITDLLLAFC